MENRQLTKRIILSLIFAASSMIITNQGTDFYLKNLDKTQYFTVSQPVQVENETYKPGESIKIDIVRNSSVTSRAVATVELILTNENGEKYKKTIGGNEFNINKSVNEIICINFKLPSDVVPGEYYLEAIVNYKVKGIEKNYIWKSEEFKIIALDSQ